MCLLLNKLLILKQKTMLKNVKQLKKERPDLVELFESMTHEQLLKQIYKECLDGINMEERVQIFMNEVTGLSKTNYTPEVIKGLIQKADVENVSEFCITALDDILGMDIDEIKDYLRNEIVD